MHQTWIHPTSYKHFEQTLLMLSIDPQINPNTEPVSDFNNSLFSVDRSYRPETKKKMLGYMTFFTTLEVTESTSV